MKRFFGLRAKLYGHALLDDFMPIYPLYAVMFTDTGLNAAQISSLLFAWSLTAFFSEVPSGAIADKYPRKYVLIIGQALRAIGFALWFLVPNYWGFLIGFILWGLKGAFASGTTQALVYDELKNEGKQQDFGKVWGRMSTLQIIGELLANVAGAVMVIAGYGWLLIAGVVIDIANIIILSLLPKAKKVESTGETRYFAILKEGITYALKTPAVLRIIALTTFVIGFASIDEYYGVFFEELGMETATIAWWAAAASAVGALAGLAAHKLEHNRHFANNASIGVMVVVWGGLLGLSSVAGGIIAPFLIVLFAGFFYLMQVLGEVWVQHAITTHARATVTSVQGFFAEVCALAAYAFVGFFAQIADYATAFRYAAYLTMAFGAAMVLFALLRRRRVE
ncbi:MAG TPA: MFS transporter [Candidatus Saccharimonadales bacterium]|nr:MFS transporter [Candidatus Saccharimonadales bacterium]